MPYLYIELQFLYLEQDEAERTGTLIGHLLKKEPWQEEDVYKADNFQLLFKGGSNQQLSQLYFQPDFVMSTDQEGKNLPDTWYKTQLINSKNISIRKGVGGITA